MVTAATWAGYASAQETLSFLDDFTGTSFSPEFRILNPDPNRMALVEGEYALLVTHRDEKNVLAYTGALPETFEATIRVESGPVHEHQGIELGMGDLDVGIAVGMYMPEACLGGCRGFFFDKYLDGETSTYWAETEDTQRPFFLRIAKSGVEYTGLYSFDGERWFAIGTHVSVRPYDRPAIKAYVWKGEAPESAIKVDRFEIVDSASR